MNEIEKKNLLELIERLKRAEIGNPERLLLINYSLKSGKLLSEDDQKYLDEKRIHLEKIHKDYKPNVTVSNSNTQERHHETFQKSKVRPTGITILGVLYIIGGIVWTLIAIVLGAITSLMIMDMEVLGAFSALGGIIVGFFAVIAGVQFVIAGGLFSGKYWGRIIVISFAIIDLVIESASIFGGNVFGISFMILDSVVLYYMWRPHVIKYFNEQK